MDIIAGLSLWEVVGAVAVVGLFVYGFIIKQNGPSGGGDE